MTIFNCERWKKEIGEEMISEKQRLELKDLLNEQCIHIILSKPKQKGKLKKIKIRPIRIHGELLFQWESFIEQKVYHKNLTQEETIHELIRSLEEDFMQGQLELTNCNLMILLNKKGKCTFIYNKTDRKKEMEDLFHNRKKKYILEEGKPVPFLQDLGVMTEEGKVIKSRYDKFRQINRFLEFVQDILQELPIDREITLIDFGCGKSYLTFAMYYFFKVLNNYDIRIIGLDLKEDVIQKCTQLKEKYGYEKLEFLQGDIASYTGVERADMVVTLHACDTATDYALAKAVQWKAKVILSVPCCQHELNQQIENDLLRPILSYGIIKERMSALLTDALRAEYLEGEGYQTKLLEFIDMDHTPKNILIRGIFKGKKRDNKKQIEDITKFFHANLTLERLLKEEKDRN